MWTGLEGSARSLARAWRWRSAGVVMAREGSEKVFSFFSFGGAAIAGERVGVQRGKRRAEARWEGARRGPA